MRLPPTHTHTELLNSTFKMKTNIAKFSFVELFLSIRRVGDCGLRGGIMGFAEIIHNSTPRTLIS